MKIIQLRDVKKTDIDMEGVSGRFFERVGDGRTIPIDAAAARRLWDIAEVLVGMRKRE